jgi:hypothetical protein
MKEKYLGIQTIRKGKNRRTYNCCSSGFEEIEKKKKNETIRG